MSNLIIVEGETEEKFFRIYKDLLKKQSLIKCCNLFQNSKKNNRIFGERYDNVYVILDSDIFSSANWGIFKENYKKINATKKFVFIQNQNFEDELVYALGINNKNNLYKLFSVTGDKKFKSMFLKIQGDDCKNRLKNLDFNKLYIRFDECKEQIPKDIKLSILDNKKIFKIK